MNVNGASTNYFTLPTKTTQGSQQPATVATGQPSSADGNSSASTSGSGPLGSGDTVLSSVQTTLPDGRILSVERTALSGAASNTAAAQSIPTDADKKSDNQMLTVLKELAGYFNYDPSAAEIQLGGTAAIDLKA